MNNLMKILQLNQSRSIQPQDLDALKNTDNIYKIVSIIGTRANQVDMNMHLELKQKLREFDSYSDNLDEYRENKEQAEMSQLYETLPHPTLVALHEYKSDELVYRKREELEQETSQYLLQQEQKS